MRFGRGGGQQRFGPGLAAGAPLLIRRGSVAGLAGDHFFGLLRDASHDVLPLLTRVVRKGLINPFRDGRIVSGEIGHITSNSLLADCNYRGHISLGKGYVMLVQFIAQLVRFTRERGHHGRVCARTN